MSLALRLGALLLLLPLLAGPSRAQAPEDPAPTPRPVPIAPAPAVPAIRVTPPATLGSALSPGTPEHPRTRLKDLATVAGANSHSLLGYGLVAGLGGVGDSTNSMTSPMMANLMARLGLELGTSVILNAKAKNVAIVAVTAELPPFARSGDTLDVTVSSLGDAKSLNGGTLLMSLLRGPDGKVYASAQGRVADGSPLNTTGGGGGKGPAAGSVQRGATVSQNVVSPAFERPVLVWVLNRGDLTTATRVAAAINRTLMLPARATGPQTVEVDVSAAPEGAVAAAAAMSNLYIEEDVPALVIVDRRSGTVVAGRDVKLRPATISSRGYTIEIPAGTTIQEVVTTFNKMGALLTPEDLAGILQAMKDSGSLTGEVVIR